MFFFKLVGNYLSPSKNSRQLICCFYNVILFNQLLTTKIGTYRVKTVSLIKANATCGQQTGPRHEKTYLRWVVNNKTSLRIRAVWSAPLLFAYWKVSYINLLQAKFQFSSYSLWKLRRLVWASLFQKPRRQVCRVEAHIGVVPSEESVLPGQSPRLTMSVTRSDIGVFAGLTWKPSENSNGRVNNIFKKNHFSCVALVKRRSRRGTVSSVRPQHFSLGQGKRGNLSFVTHKLKFYIFV